MKKFCLVALLITCFTPPSVKGFDDDEESKKNDKLYDAELIRVSELGVGDLLTPFVANGTDTLSSGSVEVRRQGDVRINIRRARANAVYSLWFCPHGQPFPACQPLGALTTNSDGNVHEEFAWTISRRMAAGIFVVLHEGTTRTAQFASGFALNAPTVNLATEIELSGRVNQLNQANRSFRLQQLAVDIHTDNDTKFTGGLRDFRGLQMGMTVEVDGVTRPDGSIRALKVQQRRNND